MLRCLSLVLFLVIVPSPGRASDSLPFADEQPANTDCLQGRARIEMDDSALKTGGRAEVRFTFFNTAGGCQLYNPFFNPLVPFPGKLALYDAEKRYKCDLIAETIGSRRPVGKQDLVYVWAGSHVGATIAFSVTGESGRRLAPGTYYIQLVLLESFVSPDGVGTYVGDEAKSDRGTDEIVCRSNVITVTVS